MKKRGDSLGVASGGEPLDESVSTSMETSRLDGRRRHWFIVLCIVVSARSLLPGAINYISQAHDFRLTDSAPRSPAAEALGLLLGIALIALAGCIFVMCEGWRGTPRTGYWLFLALAVYSFLHNAIEGASTMQDALRLIELLALWLAILGLSPTLGSLKSIGAAGLAVALLSIVYGALLPSHAFMPDSMSAKALIGDRVLVGIMSHANSLGVLVVMALPFVLLWKSTASRVAAVITMVTAISWSGSRTAIVAGASALLLVAVLEILPAKSRHRWASATLVIAGSCVVVLPLIANDASLYSGRGAVWIWVRQAIGEGRGLLLGISSRWPVGSDVVDGGLATSAHNLFMQLLYTGGLVKAWIVFGLFWSAAKVINSKNLPKGHLMAWAAYLLIFLVISITEYVLVQSPGSELFVVVALPLLIGVSSKRATQGGGAIRPRH